MGNTPGTVSMLRALGLVVGLIAAISLAPRADAATAAPGAPAVPGTGIAPLFPDLFDREIVQRVQTLLQGIGLYRGPVDGTMSEATRQGIRDYQRASGLPIDSEATKALIAHLESAAGQGQRLIQRLDEIKDDQIRSARAGLLSRPETRNLVATDPGSDRLGIADPTRDPTACFKDPTTACLLGEALETTKSIARVEFRDWALGDIIQVHTRLGDFTAAWRTAGLIQDARSIVNALGSIARTQTEVGSPSDAVATARLIPDSRLRGETLLAIMETLLHRGLATPARAILGETLEATASLVEPRQTVPLLSRLAVAQARLAETADSGQTLARAVGRLGAIEGNIDRATAIAAVASAQAAIGDTPAALASVARIGESHLRGPALIAIVTAQVEQGDTSSALATAKTIEDARYRVTALARIAGSQISKHGMEAAKTTIGEVRTAADRVDFGYAKSYALSQVAELLVATGAFEDATIIAGRIEDERLRAQVYWQVASAQQGSGDQAGFERSWTATNQAIRAIISGPDRAWMLSTIAIEEARRGDRERAKQSFTRAVEAVSDVRNPWFRARSLSRLALALAEMN
ncbi:MAG: hypothetical protein EXQ96_01735 [Alphaproteobacteria bacterium]|nr:hypothetical protein [Alphaproteobacteria bacterium]